MDEPIQIRGARQHNLKGFDLDLPRGALTVITGPSGSGKSSLALDTLYAAGQRRYVEALSTYARQFLDRMEKPDVDAIEGLSPAVAIEQAAPVTSSRSTVGTATDVYDFLRLLYARVGRTRCPECGAEVCPDSVSDAVDRIAGLAPGTRLLIAFPLARSGRTSHDLVARNLRSLGFIRVLADGVMTDLGHSDLPEPDATAPDLAAAGEVMVVVDRIRVSGDPGPGWTERLADSLAVCFREGEGEAVAIPADRGASDGIRFTEHFRCPAHPDIGFLEPTPRLFSFNTPYGSCPACTGFGETLAYDPGLVIPDEDRSLEEGAVDPWAKPRYTRERADLRRFAVREGVSRYTPWKELPQSFREAILFGRDGFRGVMDFLVSKEPKRYKPYIRIFLRRYQRPRRCRACSGSRLIPEAGYVTLGGQDIAWATAQPVEDLLGWLEGLDLRPMEAGIAANILRELSARVGFLVDVGLGYLALNRRMRTVSGGEAQRISLANALGSRLVDTLYVLDEPSVGLHPRDTRALLGLLKRLRDTGNTVVVVEHSASVIRAADHVVELGPGAGENGGEVVFEGTAQALEGSKTSTGRYFSRADPPSCPPGGRPLGRARLRLEGATLHNLKGVDAEFPVEAVTAVTGVSGSGKSTLVHDILYRALERELSGGTSAKVHLGEGVGRYRSLSGLEHVEDVVLVDQSPIGRTPRSNPVTYIRAWSEVRRIFARQPAAAKAGLTARSFSFNVKGGRCEACKGAGYTSVEMVFMSDIYVPCEVCDGKRYRPEVLQVAVQGLNVNDVLELTVDRALRFFLRERKLGQSLWHLQRAGLGYLRLGQPATTLSGGEAQRLKIARELIAAAKRRGRKMYILDEPTTGLSGEDVARLNAVLRKLVESGNTLVVVEHDLDVVRAADWVIDMGPGAGDRGGEIVAMGRPGDVATMPESITGQFLANTGR